MSNIYTPLGVDEVLGVGGVHGPLHPHEEGQVPEHAGQEDNLWNELGEDVQRPLEVRGVPVGHAHPEGHVDDAQDDGDLHLERVQEHDLVLRNLPITMPF